MCGKVVAYYRVSTDRQGRSGLGLDAQKAAVEAFVRERGGEPVAEFVEVESGKRDDRPELDKAIRAAKLSGARLLIAKLDRLGRNAAFLLKLRESGVRFVAVDMPEADDFTVGVLALVAQREREMISARTRAALAAAKARGRTLGTPGTLRPGEGQRGASGQGAGGGGGAGGRYRGAAGAGARLGRGAGSGADPAGDRDTTGQGAVVGHVGAAGPEAGGGVRAVSRAGPRTVPAAGRRAGGPAGIAGNPLAFRGGSRGSTQGR